MLRSVVVLVVLACAGHAGAIAAAPTQTDAQAQVRQALALPEALRTTMQARVAPSPASELERVQRLVDFMIADDGLALRYQEQPTLDIAGSYEAKRVNCLSFTLMFIALARASGLQARAQASGDALAMRVQGDTMFRTSHVNAGVRIEGRWHSVDVGWRSLVASHEPTPISDMQALALLRNNNAIEHLVLGDKALAVSEIAASLALDPASATAWNNAGVVAWRAGRVQEAERAYLHALQLQPDHIGALGNIVRLYRDHGAPGQVERYEKRLRRVEANDPFSQFLMAQSLAGSGAYGDAVVHYRRAIRLMPDEPEFHRNLADALEKQGKAGAAERARQRAEILQARRSAHRAIRSIAEAAPG